VSTESTDRPASPSKLLAYLQLFRAPNVFTAIADVAMGFLFVHGSFAPASEFACLVLASCLLYTAGMVLNDVYDVDVDAEERPSRPLPSGRISKARAQFLGYAMLAAGIGLGWAVVFATEAAATPIWRSGAIATLLAACVVGYDALLKKTALGPLMMGACRFFNVLLGMSLGACGDISLLRFDTAHLLVAGGIGIYIVGVTWFARTEAKQSNRGMLACGVMLMAVGIAMLGLFPRFASAGIRYYLEPTTVWPAVLFLLTFSILRRCLVAVADPSPKQVQAAIKHCILSLIVLDAAVSLLAAGYLAIFVLALLAPTLLLGKWVYST
jgi:4-hydroxybenzoate polyprenyltransferase